MNLNQCYYDDQYFHEGTIRTYQLTISVNNILHLNEERSVIIHDSYVYVHEDYRS